MAPAKLSAASVQRQVNRIETMQCDLMRQLQSMHTYLKQERDGIVDANKAQIDAQETLNECHDGIITRLAALERLMADEIEGLRAAKIFHDSFKATIEKIYAKP